MYKVTKRDCPMFGIGPYICEFICDTASDITTLPTSISEGTGGRTAYDNQKCASGSIAIIAENGSESKQYMLNNQDIWCPYSIAVGNSGGGSSESPITIDFALSETSENPVANKVITAALDDKANNDDIPNIKVNAAVDADTVNGHSVNADVPENAKFTDTIPDLSPYALKSKYGDTTINVGRKDGTTVGRWSTAEGNYTTASGNSSHAEGASTTASDSCSHAEGYLCTASSDNSHAEGNNTTASGAHSHSEGDSTIASGIGSHSGGASSTASGDYSFSHGMHVESNNSCEVSLGKFNKSSSDTRFSVGDGTSDTTRHNAFEITKTGGKLHDKDIATTDLIPTELPANGGNADTVGDFDAYHMGTTTSSGGHYPPEQFPLYCQYNTYDDGRFAFKIDNSFQPDSKYEVRCDYAANAGDANTLGGKSISDFIYAHGYYTGNVDDIKYPFSGIIINATGTPPQTSAWGTMLCYGGGTGSYAQIWVNNKMFVRHFDGERWTEWKNIADGGNANTVGGKDPGKIFYDNGMSSDLDSATKSGCYGASPDTLNTPLSSWWLVDTMNYNNQFIVQKAHQVGDATRTPIYVRNYANNAWSNWSEISTTATSTT